MRKLDHWIKSYMAYSSFSESPDKFHFWVAISTIAGALKRRVWIDQGYFQWTPNFYIILVAPPGIISKSTTLSIGMNLLKQLDGIKFGPNAVTWPSLVQSLAEAKEEVLMPDEMYHPMCCLTFASSEFGTFLNPNDREMLDVLVELWDSQIGNWEKRTKTQGSDLIVNPWINIAACTTPGWLAGNVPEHLIGGGFTSRCVFVFGKEKRRLVAYPSAELPPEFEQMQRDLVHDLEHISTFAGSFILSPQAIQWGTEWYASHWKNHPRHLDNERFAGYLSRKQTHIHKLAMVLSVSYKDERIIAVQDLSMAADIITALEADMPEVFSQIGLEGGAKHSSELLAYLRKVKKATQTELYKYFFRTMSYKDFVEALAGCANSRQITMKQEAGDVIIYYLEG